MRYLTISFAYRKGEKKTILNIVIIVVVVFVVFVAIIIIFRFLTECYYL